MTTDRQFSDGVRAAFAGRRIAIPAPSYQYLAPSGEIDHGRRERALDVPTQIMAKTGMSAAELAGLRDALQPFAGGRAH